jgi:hypothetical protein
VSPFSRRGLALGRRVPLSVESNIVSSGIVVVVQLSVESVLSALFTCKQHQRFGVPTPAVA